MSKRPGSIVLTFSKKNIDIRGLLENKKCENENFVITDYICEAIRFYEKNRDYSELNNLSDIKNLIDERLKQFISANSSVTYGLSVDSENISKNNVQVKEKVIINEIKTIMDTLESDLDNIPIEED